MHDHHRTIVPLDDPEDAPLPRVLAPPVDEAALEAPAPRAIETRKLPEPPRPKRAKAGGASETETPAEPQTPTPADGAQAVAEPAPAIAEPAPAIAEPAPAAAEPAAPEAEPSPVSAVAAPTSQAPTVVPAPNRARAPEPPPPSRKKKSGSARLAERAPRPVSAQEALRLAAERAEAEARAQEAREAEERQEAAAKEAEARADADRGREGFAETVERAVRRVAGRAAAAEKTGVVDDLELFRETWEAARSRARNARDVPGAVLADALVYAAARLPAGALWVTVIEGHAVWIDASRGAVVATTPVSDQLWLGV